MMSEEEQQCDGLLWHYTSVDAALSIMQTNELWATHSDFMNDVSEARYVEELLLAALEKEPESQKLFDIYKEFDGRIKATLDGVFILSFCLHKFELDYHYDDGILGMWRAYGNSEIAIGFDKEEMSSLFEKISANRVRLYEQPTASKVTYVHTSMCRISEDKLPKAISSLLDLLKMFLSRDYKNQIIPDKMYKPYIESIMYLKHDGFREENEYRYVSMPATKEHVEQVKKEHPLLPHIIVDPIDFREPNIPYVPLFRGMKHKLPIKKIIIGPSPKQEQRYEYIRLKLAHELDMSNVEIVKSSVPYRPSC